jgi:hypothetical protein
MWMERNLVRNRVAQSDCTLPSSQRKLGRLDRRYALLPRSGPMTSLLRVVATHTSHPRRSSQSETKATVHTHTHTHTHAHYISRGKMATNSFLQVFGTDDIVVPYHQPAQIDVAQEAIAEFQSSYRQDEFAGFKLFSAYNIALHTRYAGCTLLPPRLQTEYLQRQGLRGAQKQSHAT